MTRLFALAIFFSATLLFMVQPLAGKILLPVLGGSPAVWSACMVFFQAVLLLGYLYAHALSTRVPRRWQWPVHVCVLIAAEHSCCRCRLRSASRAAPIRGGGCCRTLAGTVGLPFFALSATAPLLQQWFSRTDDPEPATRTFCTPRATPAACWDCWPIRCVEPVADAAARR